MKKNYFKLSFVLIFVGLLFFSIQAKADESVTIRLQIKTNDASLYDQDITVTACADSATGTTTTVNAKCAIEQSGLANDWSWYGEDAFLNSVGSYINNSNSNGIYWGWFSNLEYGQVALNKHGLVNGEKLLLVYNTNPLRISTDNITPDINATTTITVEQFGLDASWNPVWSPAASSSLVIDGQAVANDSGVYEYAPSTAGDKIVYAKKDGLVNSDQITIAVKAVENNNTPPEPVLATSTIRLQIKTNDLSLYDQDITVIACADSATGTTTTVNAKCAIEQSGLVNDWSWSDYGAMLTSLGGYASDSVNWWGWYSDLVFGQVGLNKHELVNGEKLLLAYNTRPLRISVDNAMPDVNTTSTITVEQSGYDAGWNQAWFPAASSTLIIDGQEVENDSGVYVYIATTTGQHSIFGRKAGYVDSEPITITAKAVENNNTPQADQANITIRNGATVVFSGAVALPDLNAASVDIMPTNASSTVASPARSLISVLKNLDIAQDEFAITNLQYDSNWDSLYIKCITTAAGADPLCDSWLYNLNGTDPLYGMDKAILKNGDVVFVYFGIQHQVVLSTTAGTVGVPFTATAQRYNPINNTLEAITGVTIGVTQPDPSNPGSPIEIATSTVDSNGQAVFTLNTAGAYNVGIKEDYYFPLTALAITASEESTHQRGGGTTTPLPKVNLAKAVNFLTAKQQVDGSFGSITLTDWASVALGSVDPNSPAGQKVRSYLLTDPSPFGGMNDVSDYSRRSMALMSLNINPYNGTKTNYIKEITDLFKDGQFGDSAIYNDDIFALIALNKAGYTADDEMIKQDVNFVVARQEVDGSWQGVDLTAAAIQALKPFASLSGVNDAIAKARSFLAGAEQTDGGFGNLDSTTWALQAISALGESGDAWQKNGKTPGSYLALSQSDDGGLDNKDSTAIDRLRWTNSAIPAVQGKPWYDILKSFTKENVSAVNNVPPNSSPSGGGSVASFQTASSTDAERLGQATSTDSVILRQVTTTDLSQINLDQASTTPVAVDMKKFDKNKKVKLITGTIKPRVLGRKITSGQPPAAKTVSPPEINAPVKQPAVDRTVNATANNSNALTQPDGDTNKKINQGAKKALLVAGGGAILAGILLVLKLLGVLL